MTITEQIAALESVRDMLDEARRYARADPLVAGVLIDDASEQRVVILGDFVYYPHEQIMRILENLEIGIDCLAAAPVVTVAYTTGALWELGEAVSRLRKQRDRAARDAELTEAYGPKE
jgi:hypothetical protein